ncbi:MAG: cupin domain-containing protein [Desulfobacterales bacterium]|jgi:quercetin dioxygenase-like cupin family protein
MEYKIDFTPISWVKPLHGARFKAYKQYGRQLRLVEFTKEFIEPDWCMKGHIGYVLEGQMEINFDGTKVIFDAGDGIFIPAGADHKHMDKVLTDKVKLILVESV